MTIFNYVNSLKVHINPFTHSSKLLRNLLATVPPKVCLRLFIWVAINQSQANTQVSVNIINDDKPNNLLMEYKNGQSLNLNVNDELDYTSFLRQVSKIPNELKLKEAI